jgi:hypothetical protein
MKQGSSSRDPYMDAILRETARHAAAGFKEDIAAARAQQARNQAFREGGDADSERYAHFHGSRQTGKTAAGFTWALDAAKEPGSRVCMMTPQGERYIRNAGRDPEAIDAGS